MTLDKNLTWQIGCMKLRWAKPQNSWLIISDSTVPKIMFLSEREAATMADVGKPGEVQ